MRPRSVKQPDAPFGCTRSARSGCALRAAVDAPEMRLNRVLGDAERRRDLFVRAPSQPPQYASSRGVSRSEAAPPRGRRRQLAATAGAKYDRRPRPSESQPADRRCHILEQVAARSSPDRLSTTSPGPSWTARSRPPRGSRGGSAGSPPGRQFQHVTSISTHPRQLHRPGDRIAPFSASLTSDTPDPSIIRRTP